MGKKKQSKVRNSAHGSSSSVKPLREGNGVVNNELWYTIPVSPAAKYE